MANSAPLLLLQPFILQTTHRRICCYGGASHSGYALRYLSLPVLGQRDTYEWTVAVLPRL
jgi:hypothetical protein